MKNSIRMGLLVGSTALLGSLAHADKWSDQFPHIKNTATLQANVPMNRCRKKITVAKN